MRRCLLWTCIPRICGCFWSCWCWPRAPPISWKSGRRALSWKSWKALRSLRWSCCFWWVPMWSAPYCPRPSWTQRSTKSFWTCRTGSSSRISRNFPLTRFPFWTGIPPRSWGIGRWGAWWIWCPSLRWMICTARSITRTGRFGCPRCAMQDWSNG